MGAFLYRKRHDYSNGTDEFGDCTNCILVHLILLTRIDRASALSGYQTV